MCFSLVFACLSVRLGAVAQEPCPSTPHPHLPVPPWEQRPEWIWSPRLGGSWQAGPGPQPPLWLQSPVCVYACVRACECMYMGNLCASMYKGRGSLSQRLGAGEAA